MKINEQKFYSVFMIIMINSFLLFIWKLIIHVGLFEWIYRLEPVNVWLPYSETRFFTSNLIDIIFVFIFVLIYVLIHKSIPGKGLFKGLNYGLVIWSVSILPRVLALMDMTVISPVVLGFWLIDFLIIYSWQGILIAAMYKEDDNQNTK